MLRVGAAAWTDATLIGAALLAGLTAALAGFAVTAAVRYRARATPLWRTASPSGWLTPALVCALAAIGGALLGPPGLAAGAISGALLPNSLARRRRRRRLLAFANQLPDAMLLLAASARAGASLGNALRELAASSDAPLRDEIADVLHAHRLGATLADALGELDARMPCAATHALVASLQLAIETGGGLADTLERLAASQRARLRLARRLHSLTAQGRLQAWVMGLLPALLLLVLTRIDADAMAVFWQTPVGWAALATIAVMEATGIWWMRRMLEVVR